MAAVDRVLLNPWFGGPVFLTAIWLLFELTTKFAAPLQDLIDSLVNGPVASAVTGTAASRSLSTKHPGAPRTARSTGSGVPAQVVRDEPPPNSTGLSGIAPRITRSWLTAGRRAAGR